MSLQNPSEKMVKVPESLIEDIHYHLSVYDTTTSRTNAGYHLSSLMDRVSDLASYHSGRDEHNGSMPWEREGAA